MKVCSQDNCNDPIHAKGLCNTHYRRLHNYGRLHVTMRFYQGDLCAIEECARRASTRGYCQHHYKKAIRLGEIVPRDKDGGPISKRSHPLYGMWFSRKESSALSPEWFEDFWRFVRDIGPKPGKFYTLVTKSGTVFGPDNFEWRAQIKRLPGETKKAFHARKWATQNERRPGWDRSRTLKRKYGITHDQYDEMVKTQRNVCAICGQSELSSDPRTFATKRLAVDHCHNTGKIRALLCQRCNTVIGNVGESIDLLGKMQAYLRRHECEAA